MEIPHRTVTSWLFAFAFFVAALMLTLAHLNLIAQSGAGFWEPVWFMPTLVLAVFGLILVANGIYVYMRKQS